jgi:hypothetical protein
VGLSAGVPRAASRHFCTEHTPREVELAVVLLLLALDCPAWLVTGLWARFRPSFSVCLSSLLEFPPKPPPLSPTHLSSPSLPLYLQHISSIIARYHRAGPVVRVSIQRVPVHIHFHHSLSPRGPSRQEAALLSMRPDTAMNQTPIRNTEII